MRRRALLALCALLGAVPRPGRAAPDIGAELTAPESGRRIRAARELGGLDPDTARPLVRRALDDLEPDVRAAAVTAVGQLGLIDLAPLLLERATAPDARVREAAIDALARLSPSPSLAKQIDASLARALGDPEPTVRLAALRAFADRPIAGADRSATLQALTTALTDERPDLRRVAAETLERLADPFALHALAGRVDDPSPEVRTAVARALGALGDRRAAPAVLRLVEDSADEVRAAAITTLGTLGAEAAVPQLVVLLGRPHDPLAGLAAVALGRIAGAPPREGKPDPAAQALRERAGETLVSALQSSVNRAAALEGLHSAGPVAARLLRPLLPALGPRPADDVLLVAGDLAAAGDQASCALLLELQRLAADGRFDAQLVRARPAAGPSRDALVAWLAGRLADPGVAARRAAAAALGSLGDARAAQPLQAALKDSDAQVRRAALLSIAQIASPATSAPFLLDAARSDDRELQRAALFALAKRHDEPSRAALVAALSGSDVEARAVAALALSDDSGAQSAVPPLLGLLKSGDASLREQAALALLGPLRRHADAKARAQCLALLDDDGRGAAGAIELLGAMRDRTAAPRLIALIPRLGRRPVRRARVYAALGDLLLDGGEARSALPSEGGRRTSPSLEDEASIERALVTALDDPDPFARAAAAWSLGKARAGDKGNAVDALLLSHLADPAAPVRANALASLARRGHAVPSPALQRLVLDGDPAVRANAVRLGVPLPAMGRRGEEPACVQRAEAARLSKQAIAPRGGEGYALLRLLDAPDGPLAARVTLADGLTVVLLADERGVVRDDGLPPGELVVAAASGR